MSVFHNGFCHSTQKLPVLNVHARRNLQLKYLWPYSKLALLPSLSLLCLRRAQTFETQSIGTSQQHLHLRQSWERQKACVPVLGVPMSNFSLHPMTAQQVPCSSCKKREGKHTLLYRSQKPSSQPSKDPGQPKRYQPPLFPRHLPGNLQFVSLVEEHHFTHTYGPWFYFTSDNFLKHGLWRSLGFSVWIICAFINVSSTKIHNYVSERWEALFWQSRGFAAISRANNGTKWTKRYIIY